MFLDTLSVPWPVRPFAHLLLFTDGSGYDNHDFAGTSSGLGKCLVTSVLNRGDCVIATVRNHPTASAIPEASEHRHRFHAMTLDITDSEENIRKVVSEACQVWGRIDILVNNAGRAAHSLLEEGG